ncbi:sensor histidine kinase [Streptomyces sioyaensis]|uniref:sensor histidine kinase n=1 Tax=Streptomyces sioyaensis TaxID=67364 RepID=UPI00379AF882
MRVRLTALYSGLFLLSGTLLIAVIYVWFEQRADQAITIAVSGALRTPQAQHLGPATTITRSGRQSPQGAGIPPDIAQACARLKNAMLQQLLTISGIALVLLVLLAVLLGWLMAGHVLRPVHEITTTARRLSWENLHERIGLTGRPDEFKGLADTFDALLDRLHTAFESQQRFIANASHELRTPLTIQRAAIQIGLVGARSPERIATVSRQLLDANRRTERLIDGLLLLATSERGLTHRKPVALEAVAAEVAAQHEYAAQDAGITVDLDLQPATVLGDPVLLTQLVTNLVHNAIRHNHPGGSLYVHTSSERGLIVRNTGPQVSAEALPELFEPFRRGTTARTGSDQGAGLGLSIVRSIAQAHAGTITAHPNNDGGLEIRVVLPLTSGTTDATSGPQARPSP